MAKPTKTGSVKTVNAETGEVVSDKKNAFVILPPRKGCCPECAVEHDCSQPHNQQSLYYQMVFQAKHGRWPTWTDAMAHCPEETRAQWKKQLVDLMQEKGIEVPADLRD